MSRSIIYMISGKEGKRPINVSNVGTYGKLAYPNVVRITLDKFASTEKTDMFRKEDLLARWDLLAGFAGLTPPEHLPLHAAVAYAEAIWLDVLLDDPQILETEFSHAPTTAFSIYVSTEFELAINDECIERYRKSGQHSRQWIVIERTCMEYGIEHKMKAWCTGVPFEDVLA